jgi:hypothetical protein
MKYKPAEHYKAEFQKVNKIWLAKVTVCLLCIIFSTAWFIYWTWVAI